MASILWNYSNSKKRSQPSYGSIQQSNSNYQSYVSQGGRQQLEAEYGHTPGNDAEDEGESADEELTLLSLKAINHGSHNNASKLSFCGWTLKQLTLYLIILKVIVVLIIFVIAYFKSKTSSSSSLSDESTVAVVLSDAECHACPDLILQGNCTDNATPVLGGLDVVQYFYFENESMVAQPGLPDYQVEYDSYVYYFINQQYKELFETDPLAYIPQFGGFCSWGIGGEYCPKYFWTATCLGPNGNWDIWTIYEDKLYFFYLQTAKDLFMENPSYYSNYGISRWLNWFGSTSATMNTNCYYNSSDGFIDAPQHSESSSSSSASSADDLSGVEYNRTLPDGAPTQEAAEESANKSDR